MAQQKDVSALYPPGAGLSGRVMVLKCCFLALNNVLVDMFWAAGWGPGICSSGFCSACLLIKESVKCVVLNQAVGVQQRRFVENV